jgi:hypothetical protein
MDSLTVTQIVPNVHHLNVDKNVRKVCHIAKLMTQMFVDILALKMEVGNKECIQESIEISRSLRP